MAPPIIFIKPEKSSSDSCFRFRFLPLDSDFGGIPADATCPRIFRSNPLDPKKPAFSPEAEVAVQSSSSAASGWASASSAISFDACFFNSGLPVAFFFTISLMSMTFLSNKRRSREESFGDGCIRTFTIDSSRLAITE